MGIFFFFILVYCLLLVGISVVKVYGSVFDFLENRKDWIFGFFL